MDGHGAGRRRPHRSPARRAGGDGGQGRTSSTEQAPPHTPQKTSRNYGTPSNSPSTPANPRPSKPYSRPSSTKSRSPDETTSNPSSGSLQHNKPSTIGRGFAKRLGRTPLGGACSPLLGGALSARHGS